MNPQPRSRTNYAGLVLAGILAVSAGVAAAGVMPSRPGPTERGMAAWAERLSHQAEASRQERSDAAYSRRLRMMAQERVNAAYADRLNGLAGSIGLLGMSDRAKRAWADRLNGLAGR